VPTTSLPAHWGNLKTVGCKTQPACLFNGNILRLSVAKMRYEATFGKCQQALSSHFEASTAIKGADSAGDDTRSEGICAN